MNISEHKFLTTVIVFVVMVLGVYSATKLRDLNFDIVNLVLLLVNSLLLLIILGILLHVKEGTAAEKNKKKS